MDRHPTSGNAGAPFPRHDGARPARGRSTGEFSSLRLAQLEMRRNRTLIGAMLVRQGKADAMLCGASSGRYAEILRHIQEVIGLRAGAKTFAAMNLLLLPQQPVFLCDTHINDDPTAEQQLVEITLLAAAEVRRFGLVPRAALLSHSSFGRGVSKTWGATPQAGSLGGRSVRPAPRP